MLFGTFVNVLLFRRAMVKEDESKLGEFAVAWWERLLDSKSLRSDCEKCTELTLKWQSVRPHQDQDDHDVQVTLKRQHVIMSRFSLVENDIGDASARLPQYSLC